MDLDTNKIYMIPFLSGPLYEKDCLPQLHYKKVEVVAIQFETDREMAQKLLPNCFEMDLEPLITITFGYYNGLDFLAGGGYNVATFQIAARFSGEKDHVEGDYIPIMFENNTTPILGGRELLGVPKLFADIPPLRVLPDGKLRCEASLWGHLLFGIELPPLKKQNKLVKSIAVKKINSRPWLGYKYIPSLDGPADADYPTITKNDISIKNLWMGKEGLVYFGSATEKDIYKAANIIDSLQKLTLSKLKQVIHFEGSAYLRLDLSRRLI
jgi:acetoacetate decarboxylase